jgi:hypothetical protein
MRFNEDLAKIHAYLCGDGCVSKNKKENKHKYYKIDFRNTNLVLLKDFQSSKLRGKIRKGRNEIKIHTIKLKNLLNLRKILKRFNIKSKIHGPWKNQYGSINYYLTLNISSWNK